VSKKHLNIQLKGRVQGVWLRSSSKDKADGLGLYGYATNLPDGSVFIELEGEDAALGEFVNWLRSSPGISEIAEISTNEGSLKNYRDFQIR
jgi:acylphosphatase